jgi:hypothetical protein
MLCCESASAEHISSAHLFRVWTQRVSGLLRAKTIHNAWERERIRMSTVYYGLCLRRRQTTHTRSSWPAWQSRVFRLWAVLCCLSSPSCSQWEMISRISSARQLLVSLLSPILVCSNQSEKYSKNKNWLKTFSYLFVLPQQFTHALLLVMCPCIPLSSTCYSWTVPKSDHDVALWCQLHKNSKNSRFLTSDYEHMRLFFFLEIVLLIPKYFPKR